MLIIAPFQGLFDGGFITRGCAALNPGLSHFTPSGLRNHCPSFSAKAGAKSKDANGVVAVGLPHRNSSVFKQADINQWEVKRRGASTSGFTSAAQEKKVSLRAVNKSGGGWGKVKAHGLCSMGLLFLIDAR